MLPWKKKKEIDEINITNYEIMVLSPTFQCYCMNVFRYITPLLEWFIPGIWNDNARTRSVMEYGLYIFNFFNSHP